MDQDGYPGIKPPWGLLNCYDLNTGKVLWRAPLGELEELTKQGVPKTGSQTLGGAYTLTVKSAATSPQTSGLVQVIDDLPAQVTYLTSSIPCGLANDAEYRP